MAIPPDDEIKQAIEGKKDHIEASQGPRIERISARKEAYERIVAATKKGMEAYYQCFPERALDERSREAETWSINGLSAIFDILDDYYITKRMETEHGIEPDKPIEPHPNPECAKPDRQDH